MMIFNNFDIYINNYHIHIFILFIFGLGFPAFIEPF